MKNPTARQEETAEGTKNCDLVFGLPLKRFVRFAESWDPKKVTTDQIFRIFYLVHLAAMLEPETQVCGVVVILDFAGLGMKQVSGFSPTFSMRLLNFIQDAMPLRLKEVHIVKQPFLFNMVWTMFKPFVREKLKGRVSL